MHKLRTLNTVEKIARNLSGKVLKYKFAKSSSANHVFHNLGADLCHCYLSKK